MSQRVLKDFPPDFIWCSTLKRASETAEVLSNTIGCSVKYIDKLREQEETESNQEFRVRGETVLSFIKENSSPYTRIELLLTVE